MKCRKAIVMAMTVCASVWFARTAEAVGASGNTQQPSQTTGYNLSGGQFIITENVQLDPSSGPWIKELTNSSGQQLFSGQTVTIVETLTNTGAIPWTDWHERVVSETIVGGGGAGPTAGFLFHRNSLSLQADYGAGLVNLIENVDYSVVPVVDFFDPNWNEINIFLSASAAINPGDTLVIQKDIFEVFGDENVWMPGEIAVIEQYPTPEPMSLAIAVVGAMALTWRRRYPN